MREKERTKERGREGEGEMKMMCTVVYCTHAHIPATSCYWAYYDVGIHILMHLFILYIYRVLDNVPFKN